MFSGGDFIGFGTLLLALLAFVRFFLARQIGDLRDDVRRLEGKVEQLEAENVRQRHFKHDVRNVLARALPALEIVARTECTCGALDARLKGVVERALVDAEQVLLATGSREVQK